jgi:hypothetical protein
MKRTDYAPLAGLALLLGYGYSQQDPHCDQGCRNNWDHLMKHLLPIILRQWGFQV